MRDSVRPVDDPAGVYNFARLYSYSGKMLYLERGKRRIFSSTRDTSKYVSGHDPDSSMSSPYHSFRHVPRPDKGF